MLTRLAFGDFSTSNPLSFPSYYFSSCVPTTIEGYGNHFCHFLTALDPAAFVSLLLHVHKVSDHAMTAIKVAFLDQYVTVFSDLFAL
jgi:hypothetical protein